MERRRLVGGSRRAQETFTKVEDAIRGCTEPVGRAAMAALWGHICEKLIQDGIWELGFDEDGVAVEGDIGLAAMTWEPRFDVADPGFAAMTYTEAGYRTVFEAAWGPNPEAKLKDLIDEFGEEQIAEMVLHDGRKVVIARALEGVDVEAVISTVKRALAELDELDVTPTDDE